MDVGEDSCRGDEGCAWLGGYYLTAKDGTRGRRGGESEE